MKFKYFYTIKFNVIMCLNLIVKLRQRLDCAFAHPASAFPFIYLFLSCSIWFFSNFLATLVGPVHCLRDLQTSLFSNFFIKNGSHSIIYTFKNYFITVFFSFQFSTLSKRTLRTLARPNASFFCFYFVCLFSFFLFYFMC